MKIFSLFGRTMKGDKGDPGTNGTDGINSFAVVSESFTAIYVLTQAEYDLIETPDSTVLYFIKP